jgi:sorbitol-6-phosphate 2-dehydrogenase
VSSTIQEKPLLDRVAIVTGGGQGLGQALSLRLALEGAHVAVADINAETATQTAALIREQTGRKAIAVQVNVTEEAEVEAMVQRAVEELGGLDILVSNAGVLRSGAIEEFDAEAWRFVMNVNLYGFFLCCKHAARAMKPQGSGKIIQINSKSGKKGSFRNSAYAASKFGGIGLTQSVALELAEYGICVNAVCPGNLLDSPLWVNSLYGQYAERWGITEAEVRQKYVDQVPMKRGCTYDDVANLVVYLASDQSNYTTGQALNVTGGQEMR